jgi:hypothetical protein
MTLFGKKSSVVLQSREQTCKTADGKEVRIVLAPADTGHRVQAPAAKTNQERSCVDARS